MESENKPEVTMMRFLSMQVCVPHNWTDKQIKNFADDEYFCGTEKGWVIRKDKELLNGDPERNPCEERKGFIHVMLDV